MDDESVLDRIERLVDEEQRLYREESASEDPSAHLHDVQVELDRCWDLLRQRRARREFGQDPDQARPRSAETVESYEQ